MKQSKLTHGSLFSGIGGFELGAEMAGIDTLWNCEIEKFQGEILKTRFPHAERFTDITKTTGLRYVDIISGGFPCQDISVAGKREGIKGKRSGLWSEMYRIIREVRPKYVIIENSSALTISGLEQVLCDLTKIGFNAEWQCLSGTDFGIQQGRERLYCVAYPHEVNSKRSVQESVFRKPYLSGEYTRIYPGWRTRQSIPPPKFSGKSNGVPNRMDRTQCVGNAVQPIIAHYLFECIKTFDLELKK